MPMEQHPHYLAWSEALDHWIEAERHYYAAIMEKRSVDEIETAARDLDGARAKYRAVTAKIESQQ